MLTSTSTSPTLRTGEPGHRWDREPLRPRTRVFQEERELDGRQKPVRMRGPMACVTCGVPWPGTAPCDRQSA